MIVYVLFKRSNGIISISHNKYVMKRMSQKNCRGKSHFHSVQQKFSPCTLYYGPPLKICINWSVNLREKTAQKVTICLEQTLRFENMETLQLSDKLLSRSVGAS